MRAIKLSLAFTLAALVAACGTPKPASVLEGECRIAHAPAFVIKGKTVHDQDWIDETTEGLVAGCGQPRPAARPVAWDAPTDANGNPPTPKKPRNILDLLRRR